MPHSFTRDKTFWAIALQVTILNFFLGGFGPAQPLLRADQGTSLTIAGLHGTAMGIAGICAGLANSRLVHYFGRERTSWIGMWLFCTGVLMFVTIKPVAFTLTATFLSGLGTSMVINNMVTRLSHHFKEATSLALPQSNGVNSAGYVLGTLIIGTLAGTAISWRFGLLLTIPATIILYFFSRDKNRDAHDRDISVRQGGKLSRTYWIACLVSLFVFAPSLQPRFGPPLSCEIVLVGQPLLRLSELLRWVQVWQLVVGMALLFLRNYNSIINLLQLLLCNLLDSQFSGSRITS